MTTKRHPETKLLVRAIAQDSDILVMDEPASSLDYGNRLRILEVVKNLAGEGYTILLSTHAPQQALRFSDRVLALAGGTVAAEGKTEEVETAFFDIPRDPLSCRR